MQVQHLRSANCIQVGLFLLGEEREEEALCVTVTNTFPETRAAQQLYVKSVWRREDPVLSESNLILHWLCTGNTVEGHSKRPLSFLCCRSAAGSWLTWHSDSALHPCSLKGGWQLGPCSWPIWGGSHVHRYRNSLAAELSFSQCCFYVWELPCGRWRPSCKN